MKEIAQTTLLEPAVKTRVRIFINSMFDDNWKFASLEILNQTANEMNYYIDESDMDDLAKQQIKDRIEDARQYHAMNSIRPQFELES